MISTKDIAWLAGLLEGEGCFRLHEGSPSIQLGMTDQDVVLRAASMLKPRSVREQVRDKRPHWKTLFHFSVGGRRAAGWMMTLYPLLGERRQTKIRSVLTEWKTKPGSGAHNQTSDQRRATARAMVSARRKKNARHDDQPLAPPEAA